MQLRGQTSPSIVVVRVLDTSRTPVPGVGLTLMRRDGRAAATHLEPFAILSKIKPADIASMIYKSFRDTSMPGIGAENALYIALKPGIAFDVARGTYHVDSVP